jgi:hypothetical protein
MVCAKCPNLDVQAAYRDLRLALGAWVVDPDWARVDAAHDVPAQLVHV